MFENNPRTGTRSFFCAFENGSERPERCVEIPKSVENSYKAYTGVGNEALRNFQMRFPREKETAPELNLSSSGKTLIYLLRGQGRILF